MTSILKFFGGPLDGQEQAYPGPPPPQYFIQGYQSSPIWSELSDTASVVTVSFVTGRYAGPFCAPPGLAPPNTDAPIPWYYSWAGWDDDRNDQSFAPVPIYNPISYDEMRFKGSEATSQEMCDFIDEVLSGAKKQLNEKSPLTTRGSPGEGVG